LPGELAGAVQEEASQPENALVDLLVSCGVSLSIARELVETYEEDYIKEKTAIAAAHPEYVKNKAGFLIKAIQEDWNSAEIEEKRKIEERRQRERETRLRAIKQDFDLYRKNHVLRGYEQLPESIRREFKEEYLANLNPIMKKRYDNKPDFGFEDPYYRAFLTKHKIPGFSLQEYFQQAGIVLGPEDLKALDTLFSKP
jgi:lipopolysaccharide biosynthesis protein